jgi:SAM-dependent methyltransferase
MSIGSDILMRMFGCPRGLLGWLGGVILARTNRPHAAWVVGLLDVRQQDSVLEIGFGPGVAIELLVHKAHRVAGVDPSEVMLRQATQRNAAMISERRVELRQASADHLPFVDGSFNKVLAINSMQVWSEPLAGLREISRVLRGNGRLALAFTVHSGQRREGVTELVAAAGFSDCRMVEADQAFCLLPQRRRTPHGRDQYSRAQWISAAVRIIASNLANASEPTPSR